MSAIVQATIPPCIAITPLFTSGRANWACWLATTKSQFKIISTPIRNLHLSAYYYFPLDGRTSTIRAAIHSRDKWFVRSPPSGDWPETIDTGRHTLLFRYYVTLLVFVPSYMRLNPEAVKTIRLHTYSLRSAPAQNAFPSPVIMATLEWNVIKKTEVLWSRMETGHTYHKFGESSNQFNVTLISFSSWRDIEFRVLGLFIVKTITCSAGNDTLSSLECFGGMSDM